MVLLGYLQVGRSPSTQCCLFSLCGYRAKCQLCGLWGPSCQPDTCTTSLLSSPPLHPPASHATVIPKTSRIGCPPQASLGLKC